MQQYYYKIWKWWLKVSSIGCEGEITDSVTRKLMLSNQTAIVVGILSTIYLYVFRSDFILLVPLIAFVISCTLVLLLNYHGYVNRSRVLMSISAPTVIFILGGIMSNNLAGYSPSVLLVSIAGIPLVLFGVKEYKFTLLCLSLVVFYYYSFPFVAEYMAVDDLSISYVSRPLYLSSSFVGISYFFFAFVHLKLINNEYEDKLKISVKQLSTKTALLAMREERLKKMTEELQKTNEDAIQKGNLLAFKNKEVMDSIDYAKNIQNAILPKSKELQSVFVDSFLFYRPKDIVSGDFFFIREKGDEVVLAAVDCTGHGVPGAMMTVIGHSQLKEIVQQSETLDSAKILNDLDERVRQILQQRDDIDGNNDGMDMALIVFNKKTLHVQFSGANRPLYLIREGALTKYSSPSIPIGGSQFDNKVFEKDEIQLQPGDQMYLFSDGYADQFGGRFGKKYMIKRFNDQLKSMSYLSLNDKAREIRIAHDYWKGQEEQVDDILIIGVKV